MRTNSLLEMPVLIDSPCSQSDKLSGSLRVKLSGFGCLCFLFILDLFSTGGLPANRKALKGFNCLLKGFLGVLEGK